MAVLKPGAAAEMKRRLLQVSIGVPALSLIAGIAATQTIAFCEGYDPRLLGRPVIGSFYWPWRFYEWWQTSWADEDPKTFAISRLIIIGIFGLAGLIAMNAARRRPVQHSDVHGTARWATKKEIRKSGLLPIEDQEHKGTYIGAWKGDYLRHEGAEHLLASGPMRSGKTHGLVVPNLVTWPASCVVYDRKGELWDLTSGWRVKEGNNVVLRWEPGAERNTVRYNFFDDCRMGTANEYGDIADIMEAIADPDGKGLDGHFDPAASSMLVGVALHVCYEKRAEGKRACLVDVLKALSDPDRPPEVLFKSMVNNTHLNGRRHENIALAGQEMLNKEVRERSGVQSTGTRMLRALKDPILARNTSVSDFRIQDLMNHEKPVSLYIVLPDSKRDRLRPLVRLFLSRMMDSLCSVQMISGRTPHKHRMLLMMDEFPSLGKMEKFIGSLSGCPGYGIRAFLLVQDRQQLVREYGENETVTGMCNIRIAYAPNELKTAEWITKMSGTQTINKEDVSESGNGGFGNRSTSMSYHTVGRNLLNVDEVFRIKPPVKVGEQVVEAGEEIVFVPGMYAISASQSLYFLDPEFCRRVDIPAPYTQRIRRAA